MNILELKNYMEDLVMQQIDPIMAANSNVCHCEKCRYDIAAMALTILPARYVVTNQGETYTKIKAQEQQFVVDIITAITAGINIVKNNPHHLGKDD